MSTGLIKRMTPDLAGGLGSTLSRKLDAFMAANDAGAVTLAPDGALGGTIIPYKAQRSRSLTMRQTTSRLKFIKFLSLNFVVLLFSVLALSGAKADLEHKTILAKFVIHFHGCLSSCTNTNISRVYHVYLSNGRIFDFSRSRAGTGHLTNSGEVIALGKGGSYSVSYHGDILIIRENYSAFNQIEQIRSEGSSCSVTVHITPSSGATVAWSVTVSYCNILNGHVRP